jgi:DNA mismatch repair protein MutS
MPAPWCPPRTERSQGGFIAEGYDAALDELRAAAGNSRRAIAALEARYRDETGVAALKIRHNGVLGYFIEVPARHADRLMAPDSGFTHRQTMAGAVRFNALALHEEASRIAEAGGHAAPPGSPFRRPDRPRAVAAREAIAATAAALARIDVAASHAERAGEGGWCLPQVVEEPVLARAAAIRWSKPRWPRLASASSPTIASFPKATACGWLAAPTWAASPPSCARTR